MELLCEIIITLIILTSVVSVYKNGEPAEAKKFMIYTIFFVTVLYFGGLYD